MRKQIDVNRIVGIKDGEVYVLEYVFDDGFKGAVGYSMRPLTKQEVEDMSNDPEYVRDLWVEAVRTGNTEDGLEDFAKQAQQEAEMNDQFYCGDDNSYRADFEDMVEDLPYPVRHEIKNMTDLSWQCSGGGRCFKRGMKFDVVFNQEAVDLINEYEGE